MTLERRNRGSFNEPPGDKPSQHLIPRWVVYSPPGTHGGITNCKKISLRPVLLGENKPF